MHFHPGAIAPTGKNQVHRRRKHCRSHPRASLLGVRSTITCASNATRANHSPGDVGVVAKDDKFDERPLGGFWAFPSMEDGGYSPTRCVKIKKIWQY